jgi:hypothetical protein
MTTDIQNLKSFDPFAEADDAGSEIKVGNQQNYIHIRIQRKYTPFFIPTGYATLVRFILIHIPYYHHPAQG